MDDRDRLAFISLRGRQDRLQGLLAQWGLPTGAAGSQVQVGDQSTRPPRSVFLRLPVTRRGAWQAGRFSLRRLPAGPRPASAVRLAAGARAAARRSQERLSHGPTQAVDGGWRG